MKKSFMWLRTVVISLMLVFSLSLVWSDTVDAATLSRKKVTMYEGDTTTIYVKGALKKVKWTTSNKNVVSVKRKTGKRKYKATLQANKKGRATIKAKYKGMTLKATVTVKHSHSYTIPAKCNNPYNYCACGKRSSKYVVVPHNYGGPLCARYCTVCGVGGQSVSCSMTAATCRQKSTCIYCGKQVGGLGVHNFNSDSTCTVCGHIELYRLLNFWIKIYGSNDWIPLGITNASTNDNVFVGTNSSAVSNGYLATVTTPEGIRVNAMYDFDYANGMLPGRTGERYFDMDRTYNLPLGTRITFYIEFKGHVYQITASNQDIHSFDGNNYRYTYTMIR